MLLCRLKSGNGNQHPRILASEFSLPWVFQNFLLESFHFVALAKGTTAISTRSVGIWKVEEEQFVEDHSKRPYVRLRIHLRQDTSLWRGQ